MKIQLVQLSNGKYALRRRCSWARSPYFFSLPWEYLVVHRALADTDREPTFISEVFLARHTDEWSLCQNSSPLACAAILAAWRARGFFLSRKERKAYTRAAQPKIVWDNACEQYRGVQS